MEPCRTPDFMEYERERKSTSGLPADKTSSKPINMNKRQNKTGKLLRRAGDEDLCPRSLLDQNTQSQFDRAFLILRKCVKVILVLKSSCYRNSGWRRNYRHTQSLQ